MIDFQVLNDAQRPRLLERLRQRKMAGLADSKGEALDLYCSDCHGSVGCDGPPIYSFDLRNIVEHVFCSILGLGAIKGDDTDSTVQERQKSMERFLAWLKEYQEVKLDN